MQCSGTKRYERSASRCSAAILSDYKHRVLLHEAIFEASMFWCLIVRDVKKAVQLAVARLHLTALSSIVQLAMYCCEQSVVLLRLV